MKSILSILGWFSFSYLPLNHLNSTIMKRLFLFLTFCLLITHGFSQNLLLNGGAESGDLSSWTFSSNAIVAANEQWQPGDVVYPQEGSYFFNFHNEPADAALMFQEGILDDPSGELSLSGHFHGEFWGGIDLDFGEVILSHRDSDNFLISSVSTGELVPDNLSSWIEFSLELPLESNSHSWKLVLKGDRLAGSFINVYYDDLVLTHTDALSVNDTDIRDSSILYPNPFTDVLFIQEELSELQEIRIYSINGFEIIDVLTIDNNEIDLSNISSGNYLAAGYNDKQELIFKQKIIKK